MKNQVKKEIAAALKKEAQENQTFNAVATQFALRERNRHRITIQALVATMKREGFNYTKVDLEHVLIFLNKIGVGNLDYDVRGRLRSLNGLKVPLQSIGMTAVSKEKKWDFPAQPSSDRAPKIKPLTVASKLPPPAPPAPTPKKTDIKIKIEFEGKVLVFECPNGVTPKDVLAVLAGLYTKRQPDIGA